MHKDQWGYSVATCEPLAKPELYPMARSELALAKNSPMPSSARLAVVKPRF